MLCSMIYKTIRDIKATTVWNIECSASNFFIFKGESDKVSKQLEFIASVCNYINSKKDIGKDSLFNIFSEYFICDASKLDQNLLSHLPAEKCSESFLSLLRPEDQERAKILRKDSVIKELLDIEMLICWNSDCKNVILQTMYNMLVSINFKDNLLMEFVYHFSIETQAKRIYDQLFGIFFFFLSFIFFLYLYLLFFITI